MKQRFLIVLSLLLSITFAWADGPQRHVITYTAEEISAQQYWKSFSPSFPVTVPQQGVDDFYLGVYTATFDEAQNVLVLHQINKDASTTIDASTGVLIKSTSAGNYQLVEAASGTDYSESNSLKGTGNTTPTVKSLRDGLSVAYIMVLHKAYQVFVSYGSNEGTEQVPANKAYLPVTPYSPGQTAAPSIRIVEEPAVVTALDNSTEDAKGVKILRDGQLLIIRDGITYDALGRKVK